MEEKGRKEMEKEKLRKQFETEVGVLSETWNMECRTDRCFNQHGPSDSCFGGKSKYAEKASVDTEKRPPDPPSPPRARDTRVGTQATQAQGGT